MAMLAWTPVRLRADHRRSDGRRHFGHARPPHRLLLPARITITPPSAIRSWELAVEEATGESFAEYMQREVLDPLGMTNSSYGLTAELRTHAAVAHDWYNNPLPEYQYSTQAQGGLRTTPADLALFMAAHMPGPNGEPIGRNVISPESVAEIVTPVPFANEAESSHITGLGFDLIMDGDTLVGARKTGDHRGFKPIIVISFQDNQGIAIMSNSDRGAIGFLMNIACTWSADLSGTPLIVIVAS